MESDQFLTKAKFTKLVEKVVRDHKSSYMDAVVHVASNTDIELEDVKKFISTTVKGKIEAEAQRLNYLPQGNTLPVE